MEATAALAERALAARLLVEDDSGSGYELANDLVREVLYQTSPGPTRVARHRRLAGLLAGRPEAAAGHAAAAGDWAATATAWMAAAATSAGSYANRDAQRLLDQAEAAALLERAGAQLARPFGYRWRVELRHAELISRLDPPAAEGLLHLSRTYGSAKYQALAMARLGHRDEAARLAAGSGSDYLLAQVAPAAQARAAVDRLAAAVPPELRPGFLERGPLARALLPEA